MFWFFLCGALGFFCYDMYRVRRSKDILGFYTFTLIDAVFLPVHLLLYACAGIVAVIVNVDVVEQCCGFSRLFAMQSPEPAAVVRAFAIGVAGPAGLSANNLTLKTAAGGIEVTPSKSRGSALDDLANSRTKRLVDRFDFSIKVIFMR